MSRPGTRSLLVVVCASSVFLLLVQPVALAARHPTRPQTAPGVPTGPATPSAQLWVSLYNGPQNSYDSAGTLGVSPNGSTVFVTGGIAGSRSRFDYGTVAYDASIGTQLWVSRYNGRADGDDFARALGVSPDGSKVFVTGYSGGSTSVFDYATVAYRASTGTQLWVSRYNGPANAQGEATALEVSPDGSTVFVTGRSYGSTSVFDYATVAYDASTGTQLWASRYNGPANGDENARSLRVSPDGSTVLVTGYSRGTSHYDYATVAYDASTGAKLWLSRFNGRANHNDFAGFLGVSPNGSTVFVTGASIGGTSGLDYATVAYRASTGVQLWVSRYNGRANGDDEATSLGVSADGSTVFVTGRSRGSGSRDDYATVAHDASTGAPLWARRYNGRASRIDVATSLGVSPDGSTVFATGYSYGSTSDFDYATLAYDASTGTQLRVSRYNGPGNGGDFATALGVSPDGSTVFVTGGSAGDYATVAYSTT